MVRARGVLAVGVLSVGAVVAVLPPGHHALAQVRPGASPPAASTVGGAPSDTATPVYDPGRLRQQGADTVVAEVDGRVVTLGEVGDAVAELPPGVRALPFSDLYPYVLDQLVRRQALVIQAQREGLDEDPAIRRKVRSASEKVLGDETLRTEIGRKMTEAMVLARYDAQIAGRPGPEEVRLRVIMLATEAQARAAIAQLQAGADFAALARRISKDASAPAGGELGYVSRDGLNPEMGAAAFELRPGEVTPYPVRSAGAWFVAQAEDRRAGPTPAFAAVRARLLAEMIRERVPDEVKDALAAVTVRTYTIAGKEADGSPARQGGEREGVP